MYNQVMRDERGRKLPLQTLHDVMFAHDRYILALESPSNIQDQFPMTTIPGNTSSAMIPWMIEAPLNSVEILEAMLQPAEPFQIHTARHVPRGPATTAFDAQELALVRRMYREYVRFQGRLEKDRDISFVCIPRSDVEEVRDKVWGIFTPVRLHYISIPWGNGTRKSLIHPWALVLHDKPHPGSIHTYETRFQVLLGRLGIEGCSFERSLIHPGTTPLPECLWDWFAGIPGATKALPYFDVTFKKSESEEPDKHEEMQVKCEDGEIKCDGAGVRCEDVEVKCEEADIKNEICAVNLSAAH